MRLIDLSNYNSISSWVSELFQTHENLFKFSAATITLIDYKKVRCCCQFCSCISQKSSNCNLWFIAVHKSTLNNIILSNRSIIEIDCYLISETDFAGALKIQQKTQQNYSLICNYFQLRAVFGFEFNCYEFSGKLEYSRAGNSGASWNKRRMSVTLIEWVSSWP